jgi:Cytochrome oxidase complex assembly protein 1
MTQLHRSLLHYIMAIATAALCSRTVACTRPRFRKSAFVSTRLTPRWDANHCGRSLAIDDSLGYAVNAKQQSPFRLYHSSPLRKNNRNNNSDEDSFLDKAKNLAKSFLPTKWFQSQEEKEAEAERKRVKKAVKSEIKQLFKDAPLPLRMLGGMVGPILGGLASNLAEAAATQQELSEVVYQRAVANIQADGAVSDAMGDPVIVGRPFSQSSSSSSINGATTTRVELAFEVSGSRRRGVGRVVSSGKGSDAQLQVLEVQVNGKVISVSTSRKPSAKSRYPSSPSNDDNVIEAEIVGKDTKSK